MKRYIGIIALVAVFAILLIVVLVTAPKAAVTSNIQAAVTPTLTADQLKLNIITLAKDEQPSRLEIKQTDPAKTVAFKYEGAAWKIEGQEQTALDNIQVSTNVGMFTQFKGVQLVAEQPGGLTDYGLDKPSLTISMVSPSGTKTLLVGSVNQVSKLYYVKLDNDPKVWTASPSLIDAFKAWLTTPPVAPPTPTPLPTLPPTATPNLTATANATLTPPAPVPSPSATP